MYHSIVYKTLIDYKNRLIDYSLQSLYNSICREKNKKEVIHLTLSAEDKNRIAEENFNLMHYVANTFASTGIPHDELVGIATIGFTKALNSYNPNDDRKAKFSTYAVYCMKNEILHFNRKDSKYKYNTVLSGNPLYTDSEGGTLSIEDTLSTKMSEDVTVEDFILFKEDLSILMDSIRKLPEREQVIIINRYGLNGGDVLTQSKIGKKLGMTQANVSKLEWSIIEKLKEDLKGKIYLEGDNFYVDYYKEPKKKETLKIKSKQARW